MIDVGIVGAKFDTYSISLSGEVAEIEPKYIRWHQGNIRPVMVYADNVLSDYSKGLRPVEFPVSTRRIAWLIEPQAFSFEPYKFVYHNAEKFHWIFTHDLLFKNALERENHYNVLYVPCGGQWVWPSYKTIKTKTVSCFTTDKQRTPGHLLRRQIYATTSNNDCEIDFYGRGSIPVDTKMEGLADYRFSVVVESCRTPGYFSEKLIDCFLATTVPIYWGAQDIQSYFDPRGMIIIETLGELWPFLRMISSQDKANDEYERRHQYMSANMRRAHQYTVVEDWAYEHYPWVFEK